MKQIKLDEYSVAQQKALEVLGYTIVLVMFKANHVLVLVK